ncbi:hypothetical protein SAMD00023353_2700600 [Rosellinia necatrix]|uniref:Uncharacterized protein n=1 Tax=Rosellinia necatrix TaxID=77044 RepID=A0A1W2TGW5_ROSNE|nr:hypothetical protein SAMD00023353_2700600 [Rosellinia necatrix]
MSVVSEYVYEISYNFMAPCMMKISFSNPRGELTIDSKITHVNDNCKCRKNEDPIQDRLNDMILSEHILKSWPPNHSPPFHHYAMTFIHLKIGKDSFVSRDFRLPWDAEKKVWIHTNSPSEPN